MPSSVSATYSHIREVRTDSVRAGENNLLIHVVKRHGLTRAPTTFEVGTDRSQRLLRVAVNAALLLINFTPLLNETGK